MYRNCYAALPVMVETVSMKILKHITDQCLVCCDVGEPCSARQDCSDPSSLIFPFQVCFCRRIRLYNTELVKEKNQYINEKG